MKNILITGAGSYVGESVRRYILAKDSSYQIDAVDTVGDNWKKVDYTKYDVVFHVAGIAHVNADPKMEPLYYKVNRDLTIEVAKHAKAAGVKQFIFMSSQIVNIEHRTLIVPLRKHRSLASQLRQTWKIPLRIRTINHTRSQYTHLKFF